MTNRAFRENARECPAIQSHPCARYHRAVAAKTEPLPERVFAEGDEHFLADLKGHHVFRARQRDDVEVVAGIDGRKLDASLEVPAAAELPFMPFVVGLDAAHVTR